MVAWFMMYSRSCLTSSQGKTVQISAFVGNIIKNWEAFPILIVVPNSTITNWVREFVRWAPNLTVVPFHGESKARDVIKQYELYHPTNRTGTSRVKYHVLVTTYDSISNVKDFTSVFKAVRRWEVLVVDEGQRREFDRFLFFFSLFLIWHGTTFHSEE